MATNRVVYQYKDKSSGRIIDNDSIVADDANGIIEHLGGSAFRYIPKNRLSKEAVAADYGYDEALMPGIPDNPDTAPFNQTKISNDEISLGTYYDYTFGINKIELRETKPKNASGFISQDIQIGGCDYIELAVETSGGNASVEYSILDGIKETPILPKDINIVQNEKLFYGLDTRFKVDTSRPVTIFKNGTKTTISYFDLDQLEFGDDVYTISYTAVNDSHIYYPNNKKVRVKVIQRYENGMTPSTIDSIVILRHGGEKLWTM